ncbi:MAG: hypothetical protein KN64_02715 [Sulfurovum sp. AS07-7]|nr:MAG: hypothetical protein KN64_02715 [Sulfurovum sp. AS07-7]
MKYIFFTLFSFLFFISSLEAKDVKVATYNVENLFDMNHDGSEYKEYIPNSSSWNDKFMQKKLLHTSDVICDLNADILALQEVENENALNLLMDTLTNVGCEYEYSAITSTPSSAIQVAIISRYPIVNKHEIVVSNIQGLRNILEVEVEIDDNPIFLFASHWKSKRSPESLRILSAKKLKERILSLPMESEYIILGDLNSHYKEFETIESKHNDSMGETGINDILKTVQNAVLVDENSIFKTPYLHYNLWLELEDESRWSHNFFGKKQTLDNIIIPKSMMDKRGVDYINNSFGVFKPRYLFHERGYIHRWSVKNGVAEGYSDHLPIYAKFSTKAYQKEVYLPPKETTISALYGMKSIDRNYILKNIKVIFKNHNSAIIKDKPNGRAIFIYGSALKLQEGRAYDILISSIASYNGLKEIKDIKILKDLGAVNIKNLFLSSNVDFYNAKYQNEMVVNLVGIYKDKKFYYNGKSYPIFFKDKSIKLVDNSKIKIIKAQIGFYYNMQFVLWNRGDFEILGE